MAQVSFNVAFRYYEKGHPVESVVSGRKLDRNEDGFENNAFDGPEISGLWIVHGVEADNSHAPGYEGIDVLGARAVIRPIEPEEQTTSGIVIAGKQEPTFEATVVAVGPGARLDKGGLMPMELSVGDKIIYSRLAGVPYQYNGEELLIINERDVIGIIG